MQRHQVIRDGSDEDGQQRAPAPASGCHIDQRHDEVEADLDLQGPEARVDAGVAQAAEHAANVVVQKVGEQQVGAKVAQGGIRFAEWTARQQRQHDDGLYNDDTGVHRVQSEYAPNVERPQPPRALVAACDQIAADHKEAIDRGIREVEGKRRIIGAGEQLEVPEDHHEREKQPQQGEVVGLFFGAQLHASEVGRGWGQSIAISGAARSNIHEKRRACPLPLA